ncbi:hypothetical protein D3C83_257380 [compost metagenome]
MAKTACEFFVMNSLKKINAENERNTNAKKEIMTEIGKKLVPERIFMFEKATVRIFV